MPQPDPALFAAPAARSETGRPCITSAVQQSPPTASAPAFGKDESAPRAARSATILRFPTEAPSRRPPAAASRGVLATDLQRLAELWPALNPQVRYAILAMAEATGH